MRWVRRREVLKVTAAGVSILAGCNSLEGNRTESGTESRDTIDTVETTEATETPTNTERPFLDQEQRATLERTLEFLPAETAEEFEAAITDETGEYTEETKTALNYLSTIEEEFANRQIVGVAESMAERGEIAESDVRALELWMNSVDDFSRIALAEGYIDSDGEGVRDGMEHYLRNGGDIPAGEEAKLGEVTQLLEQNSEINGLNTNEIEYLETVHGMLLETDQAEYNGFHHTNPYSNWKAAEALNLIRGPPRSGSIRDELPEWMKVTSNNQLIPNGIKEEVQELRPNVSDSSGDQLPDLIPALLWHNHDLEYQPGNQRMYIEVLSINGATLPEELYDGVEEALPITPRWNHTENIEIENPDEWRDMDNQFSGLVEERRQHANYNDKAHFTLIVGDGAIDRRGIDFWTAYALEEDSDSPVDPGVMYASPEILDEREEPVDDLLWTMFNGFFDIFVPGRVDVLDQTVEDGYQLREEALETLENNAYGAGTLDFSGLSQELENGEARDDFYQNLLDEYGTGSVSTIYGND